MTSAVACDVHCTRDKQAGIRQKSLPEPPRSNNVISYRRVGDRPGSDEERAAADEGRRCGKTEGCGIASRRHGYLAADGSTETMTTISDCLFHAPALSAASVSAAVSVTVN